MASSPLGAEQAVFIALAGLSITVASRDARRVPSLVKALGCRLSPDRTQATLFVSTRQARQLLADIAATRAVAVVFSQPSTHRTIQLKGADARVHAPAAGDAAIVAEHGPGFAEELLPLGYRRDWALAIHDVGDDEVAAITFTVTDAFAQTPGPGAGARLAGASP